MAVWDAADRLMLLAGGQGYRGFLGELWAFRPRGHGTSGEWTRLAARTPPGARSGAAAAWDTANRRLLIFGGEVPMPTPHPTQASAVVVRPTSTATRTRTATATPTATPSATPTRTLTP